MKSINSFVLLLSIIKIVIAGPLPTPRHVVDVRLDQKSAGDHLPSTSPTWHLVDDSSMNYNRDNDDLDLTSGTDKDVTIHARNSVAIERRKKKKSKGKPKAPSSGGGGGSSTMSKAGEVTGDMAKAINAATEALEEVPILGEALDVVATILNVLSKVFKAVAEMEKKSNEERAAFTQKTVQLFQAKHPEWNVVCTDDKSAQYFVGTEGKDWAHQNTATHTAMGHFHYDVYGARAGIFILEGDGGFINWAYTSGGKVHGVGVQNHRLIFSGTSPSYKPVLGGKCGIHIYRYNVNADNGNKNFDLVAIIKDTKGIIVGFVGDGDLSKTVSVSGLPHPVKFTDSDQKNKDAPISIEYDKVKMTTKDCKMGKYDHGKYQQGDCEFTC